ncbi:MAG TPA: CHRD domain-containing protein [Vicinamibacterales bacterium]|nr:CHRD domain-containing protein [Vicinamibacterales bacterium]
MLRRGCLILLAALALAGCDDDSPTAPEDPNVVVFTAQLSAANEVPPVTNAESNARGDARMTFNLTRDGSNNITGATVTFVVNLNSFPSTSSWTLAHIHEGPSGVAGPVRVNTGLSPGTAISLASGGVTNQTFSNVAVVNSAGAPDPALVNAIINNPAGFYFNAHTVLNPGGAVRGQLVRQ